MKKSVVFLVIMVLVFSNFTGCTQTPSKEAETSSGEQQSTGKVKIGVAYPTVSNTGEVTLKESIDEAGAEFGYEIIYTDANNSVEKQLSDVEDLISQGIDILLIKPMDDSSIVTALEKAKEADVATFVYFREAVGVAGEDYVTVLSIDKKQEAVSCAQSIISKYGDEPVKLVVLTGTEGTSDVRDLRLGLEEFMAEHKNVTIVAEQTANWQTNEAQSVMQNIIQSTGGDFNAVICHNDGMAVGAVTALKQAGIDMESVYVATINGEPAALEMVMNGDIDYITSFNMKIGPQIIGLVDEYVKGSKMEERYNVAEIDTTKENALEVYELLWGPYNK